jgi:hypothetical protein
MGRIIECDGYYTRKLSDGRELTVYRTIFRNGRLCIEDGFFIEGSWCYWNLFDALSVMEEWNPAKDAQPPGSRCT